MGREIHNIIVVEQKEGMEEAEDEAEAEELRRRGRGVRGERRKREKRRINLHLTMFPQQLQGLYVPLALPPAL
jgi:hypothetical protein